MLLRHPQEHERFLYGLEAAECIRDHFFPTSPEIVEPNSSTTYDATLITLYGLRNCLKDMRKRAAPGPDGIQIQLIIGLKNSIMEPLLLLYNSCLSFGFIPKCMKRAKVILIPKNKGDPHSINSLRPITITSCILKILDKILSSRLSHSLEKGGFLYKNQFGFRTSRSTTSSKFHRFKLLKEFAKFQEL